MGETMNKMDLSLQFCGEKLSTPLVIASGVAGFGEEISPYLDWRKIGAFTTKTITLNPRKGNLPPRIVEVTGGVVNSIGLANPGVEKFQEEKLPFLRTLPTRIILSIGGEREEEFYELSKVVSSFEGIHFLELNLSCPNVKEGLFSQNEKVTARIIEKVKGISPFPVIAKLSPQVEDIGKIASICEKAGADAISLINAFPALVMDLEKRKPLLGGITGGLSGPAIKPLALRMVWEARKKVKIPIIGMGGVMKGKDVVEFLLAGATCVGLGTVILSDPSSPHRILKELKEYLASQGLSSLEELNQEISSKLGMLEF